MFLLDMTISPLALLLYPPIGVPVAIVISALIIISIIRKRRKG